MTLQTKSWEQFFWRSPVSRLLSTHVCVSIGNTRGTAFPTNSIGYHYIVMITGAISYKCRASCTARGKSTLYGGCDEKTRDSPIRLKRHRELNLWLNSEAVVTHDQTRAFLGGIRRWQFVDIIRLADPWLRRESGFCIISNMRVQQRMLQSLAEDKSDWQRRQLPATVSGVCRATLRQHRRPPARVF